MHGKYTKDLAARFGFRKPKFLGNGPVIWCHGASVGEVSLLLPIIKRLRDTFPHMQCLVTACSEAGVQVARDLYSSLGVVVSILPLDFSLIIRPVVRAVSPSLVIFSEGDCWMNFAHIVKELGAQTVVINGKLSETSYKRFSLVRCFMRDYFRLIDKFLVQDERYRQRFITLGIEEERICVTGNIKTYLSSDQVDPQRTYWRECLKLSSSNGLLVLGSIHPKDAAYWLPLVQPLFQEGLRILWVPRHIERVPEFSTAFLQAGISYGLWSHQAGFEKYQLIMVDEMGWLKQLYSAADIAFVGGTFDAKVGGHNLLEPLQMQVPLLFGPCISSQSELATRLIEAGAGVCVNANQLWETVLSLWHHPEKRQQLIEKGNRFLEKEKGSFDTTWEELIRHIACIKST